MELSRHDLAWIVRRCPPPVLELLRNHSGKAFVAGGFLRAVIANEEINDIDVFATDKSAAEALACELLGSVEGNKFETPNAFTVRSDDLPFPVQFIHRWTFNRPADVIASFDFTIAAAAFWFDRDWRSDCHNDFYADLAAKRLVYTSPVRNEDAGGSMLRVLKFYQRGYRIPLESLAAVIARLHQGVDMREIESERHYAAVVSGLLREVDPNLDSNNLAYMPAMEDHSNG